MTQEMNLWELLMWLHMVSVIFRHSPARSIPPRSPAQTSLVVNLAARGQAKVRQARLSMIGEHGREDGCSVPYRRYCIRNHRRIICRRLGCEIRTKITQGIPNRTNLPGLEQVHLSFSQIDNKKITAGKLIHFLKKKKKKKRKKRKGSSIASAGWRPLQRNRRRKEKMVSASGGQKRRLAMQFIIGW